MKHLTTILTMAITLTGLAQQMPYNPDENSDAFIGSADLTGFLSNYGNSFFPSEILIEEQPLSAVLAGLQAAIDSLSQSSNSASGSVLDMPVGTILPVASTNVPDGWMLCDGREISIEAHQDLYDLIGTTYGAGDSAFWAQVFYPATTFNIPDLRGRTIIGANDMGGEASTVLSMHQASLGHTGGEEMHQLTVDEMPSHSHEHSGNSSLPVMEWGSAAFASAPESGMTSSVGNDQPHNNLQPFLALNYIMKVSVSEDLISALEESITSQQNQIDSLENEVTEVSHGMIAIENTDFWVVPKGVRFVELEFYSGSGGDAGTCSCNNSLRYGSGGSNGGGGRILLAVAPGDTIQYNKGEDGLDNAGPYNGPGQYASSSNNGNSGLNGEPSSVSLNGILVAVGRVGHGGISPTCDLGAGQCFNGNAAPVVSGFQVVEPEGGGVVLSESQSNVSNLSIRY